MRSTRTGRVLHVLSQRPGLTGSGVTLDALVRLASERGWDQHVIVGVPASEPVPRVGGLPADRVHPLFFGEGELDFAVPGMSDVMPYPSTRFSSMTPKQLMRYRSAWHLHLHSVLRAIRRADGSGPDVVHAHHAWLLGSMLKDVLPDVPVVTQSHATGLRQMGLCPHLADPVRAGCERNDRFLVLHGAHGRDLVSALSVPPERVQVVGAGYSTTAFHATGRSDVAGNQLLNAGKYSQAKRQPRLLDAEERLAAERPGLTLHVAGDGSGPESDALRRRMTAMPETVRLHGQVGQDRLGDLMRGSAVFVLPSFYEGLPLVLVEALSSGCRLVCTDLPGVRAELAPHLGAALELVPLPRLIGADEPVPADLPAFVDALEAALRRALNAPPLGDPARTMPKILAPFTWEAVFERVEAVWLELLAA